MTVVQAKNDARIFVDEDYSPAEVSEQFVGRKAFSLFELRDLDVPVPPFYAVSASIFTEFIKDCFSTGFPAHASDSDIRKKIMDCSFSQKAQKEIHEGYSRLSGFAQSWVSVRSSIVLPASHQQVSFAGMLDTVLNVKGMDELLTAIKHIYVSTFTPKVAQYACQTGLMLADVKVGIVVQKMIQSEASGIVFTVDPISLNDHYLTIEAVFGLGDVIANGDITPDQYVIDKQNFEFIEKRIVPQEWMMVRKIQHKEGTNAEQRVQISKTWQHQQKIENRHIKELAKISTTVEKKMHKPQDIEWVFEGGRVWLLQTSDVQPITIPDISDDRTVQIEENILNAAQTIVDRERAKQAVKDEISEKKALEKSETDTKGETSKADAATPQSETFVGKPITRQLLKGQRTKEQKSAILASPAPLPGEKLLLTGIGASPAALRGNVVIIRGPQALKTLAKRLNKTAVLVMPDYFPEAAEFAARVGAMIIDSGGMTSDPATICRERGIPCIMGCHIATHMLHDNENVLVDGTIGAVYGIRNTKAMYTNLNAQPTVEMAQPSEPVPAVPLDSERHAGRDTVSAPANRICTATKVYADYTSADFIANKPNESLSFADGIATLEFEHIYRKIGTHPEALMKSGNQAQLIKQFADEISAVAEKVAGNPLIISIGSMSVGQYKKLKKSSAYEIVDAPLNDRTKGLPRLLKHPKELAFLFSVIRRVRNVEGWRHTSLALHYTTTPTLISDFKKHLTTGGLRRSSTFNVYMIVDTPSEALILDDFISAGIDGIIAHTKNLSEHMMATGEDDSSMRKVLEGIKASSKGIHTIAHLSPAAEDLIPFLVKAGYFAISVQSGMLESTRKAIADTERQLIMKR